MQQYLRERVSFLRETRSAALFAVTLFWYQRER
jgi:hypothetical protein